MKKNVYLQTYGWAMNERDLQIHSLGFAGDAEPSTTIQV